MKAPKPKRIRKGKLIHIRLTPYAHKALKVKVAEQGTTFQNWISRVIRLELLKERLNRKPVIPAKTEKLQKKKPRENE
jgi:hypothetical protein